MPSTYSHLQIKNDEVQRRSKPGQKKGEGYVSSLAHVVSPNTLEAGEYLHVQLQRGSAPPPSMQTALTA